MSDPQPTPSRPPKRASKTKAAGAKRRPAAQAKRARQATQRTRAKKAATKARAKKTKGKAKRTAQSAPKGSATTTKRATAKNKGKAKRTAQSAPKGTAAGTKATAKRPARKAKATKSKPGTQLALSARGTWGGYRAGAGRKRIPRDKRRYVPHTPRPKVTKSTPVHVTLRCVDGLPTLRRPSHKRLIERIFARENRKGFRLAHYSIQTNHLHLIAEGDDTTALSRGIQRIASLLARRLNRRFKRKGRFFRERFGGKVLTTPKQMRNALRYVLCNHHKHEAERANLVEGFDPFSSSRFFDGWAPASLGPKSRHRPPSDRGDPVVPPKAWLLTKGWRRHGPTLEPRWL